MRELGMKYTRQEKAVWAGGGREVACKLTWNRQERFFQADLENSSSHSADGGRAGHILLSPARFCLHLFCLWVSASLCSPEAVLKPTRYTTLASYSEIGFPPSPEC